MYIYTHPRNPSALLESVWGMSWGVKYLLIGLWIHRVICYIYIYYIYTYPSIAPWYPHIPTIAPWYPHDIPINCCCHQFFWAFRLVCALQLIKERLVCPGESSIQHRYGNNDKATWKTNKEQLWVMNVYTYHHISILYLSLLLTV